MSIAFLAQLSRSKAPLTLTSSHEVNQLVLLRAAGLVAAFTLRVTEEGRTSEYGRFLALTPSGRAALAALKCEA
jgi:hypothetical protein